MNDGHILVIILAAFVVVQTVAVGVYKYLLALADLKTMEGAAVDAAAKRQDLDAEAKRQAFVDAAGKRQDS